MTAVYQMSLTSISSSYCPVLTKFDNSLVHSSVRTSGEKGGLWRQCSMNWHHF